MNTTRRALVCLAATALVQTTVVAAVLTSAQPALADHTAQPTAVAVAGSHNSELGCPGDWKPDCASTHLPSTPRTASGSRPSTCPRAPSSTRPRSTTAGTRTTGWTRCPTAPTSRYTGRRRPVKFYYDHESHWVTSDTEGSIVDRARQLPERAGLPRRLDARAACAPGCRTPTATACTRSPRRPSRPAATRPRWPSVRRGRRTTARAACPVAPTSRSSSRPTATGRRSPTCSPRTC